MPRDRRPIARMYRAAQLEAELTAAVVMMNAVILPGRDYLTLMVESARLQRRAAKLRRWIDSQLMETK